MDPGKNRNILYFLNYNRWKVRKRGLIQLKIRFSLISFLHAVCTKLRPKFRSQKSKKKCRHRELLSHLSANFLGILIGGLIDQISSDQFLGGCKEYSDASHLHSAMKCKTSCQLQPIGRDKYECCLFFLTISMTH